MRRGSPDLILVLLPVWFLLSWPATGAASSVTLRFEGTVGSIDDPSGLLDASVQVGDAVSSHLTIPLQPIGGNQGTGFSTYLVSSVLAFEVDGFDFTTAYEGVFIGNDGASGDSWNLGNAAPRDPPFAALVFADTTGALLDDSNYFVPQSLEGWDFVVLALIEPVGSVARTILGTEITSLSVVSEPGSWLLVMLAAGAAARRRPAQNARCQPSVSVQSVSSWGPSSHW